MFKGKGDEEKKEVKIGEEEGSDKRGANRVSISILKKMYKMIIVYLERKGIR